MRGSDAPLLAERHRTEEDLGHTQPGGAKQSISHQVSRT